MNVVNAHNLAPGLNMALSELKPDLPNVDQTDNQKIDSALYFVTDAPMSDGGPRWEDQIVSIEFKTGKTGRDPFDDRNHSNQPQAEAIDRKTVFGQITHYAENVFGVQHRCHLFMLLFFGRRARIMRWDRAGVVTSEAFDYYLQWELMCRVLYHLSFLARHFPKHVGIDPTAEHIRPNDPRWQAMNDAAAPCPTDVDHTEHDLDHEPPEHSIWVYERDMFHESLKYDWPRYELQVPTDAGVRKFLVGKPAFRARGMVGRGTRGYVAYEAASKRFYWLKDTWRAYYDGIQPEGKILEELHSSLHDLKRKFKYIPTVSCHGDIRGQVTVTHQYLDYAQQRRPHPESPAQPVPPSLQSVQQHYASSSPTLVDFDASSSVAKPKRKRSEGDDGTTERATPTEEERVDNGPQLRKHQHYRLVLEEVCMPLKALPSGWHLVRIMYDCVLGEYPFAIALYAEQLKRTSVHRDAYRHNVLHRDVSGGNILIRPIVIDSHGHKRVRWAGLLADWETAKSMGSKPHIHRQPERTASASHSI